IVMSSAVPQTGNINRARNVSRVTGPSSPIGSAAGCWRIGRSSRFLERLPYLCHRSWLDWRSAAARGGAGVALPRWKRNQRLRWLHRSGSVDRAWDRGTAFNPRSDHLMRCHRGPCVDVVLAVLTLAVLAAPAHAQYFGRNKVQYQSFE